MLFGEPLDTRGCAGVVAYAPSELVITARGGTSLAEIDACLAQEGQFLAFEPPRFAAGTTIGGVIASGLAGPARSARGAVRDFVLGVQLLDGQGEVLRFGGQVMKNVAGYDVARALTGSLGTLGVLLEVSIKVLPAPVATASLRFELSASAALERMTDWAGEPLPITATAWSDGLLTVRLSGSATAVQAARKRLSGEAMAPREAESYWTALRDQEAPFFSGDTPLWRIALPACTPVLDGLGPQVFEWDGCLRWLKSAESGEVIRRVAARSGGHATLFRASDREKALSGVFTPRPEAVARIERELKKALDPRDIFNRGRIDVV
jgi:glycolate oxidase FAD binding subunit